MNSFILTLLLAIPTHGPAEVLGVSRAQTSQHVFFTAAHGSCASGACSSRGAWYPGRNIREARGLPGRPLRRVGAAVVRPIRRIFGAR